jgi:transcriptional regulator with XRE-family HTH domain
MNNNLDQVVEIESFIGEKLKQVRKECGVSQRQAADAIGVSSQQYQKYEQCKNRITPGKLFILAKFFDVHITTFFNSYTIEGNHFGEEMVLSFDEKQALDMFRKIKNIKTKKRIIKMLKKVSGVDENVFRLPVKK